MYPHGLYSLFCRLHFEYGAPRIYVTENGSAYPDAVGPDGAVHDPRRVAYLRDHLAACARASAVGVPLAGYVAWSLLDNFEWERGYTQRFGIFHVDYDTQARTPKDTAKYYAEVVKTGRVGLQPPGCSLQSSGSSLSALSLEPSGLGRLTPDGWRPDA